MKSLSQNYGLFKSYDIFKSLRIYKEPIDDGYFNDVPLFLAEDFEDATRYKDKEKPFIDKLISLSPNVCCLCIGDFYEREKLFDSLELEMRGENKEEKAFWKQVEETIGIKTIYFYQILSLIEGNQTILLQTNTIIQEALKQAKFLSKQSCEYYFKNDKKTFAKKILYCAFRPIKKNYSDEELKIIYDYILSSDYCLSILKMLHTYTFLYGKYWSEKHYGEDLFDFTSILVPLFKCVEVLFCKFLNEEFGHLSFMPNSGRREMIYLEDKDLTLGSMFKIFDTDEPEIKSFIKRQQRYANYLKDVLYDFINYSRNGYLHKDIMDSEKEYHLSLEDSLDAICLLILMFEDQ